MISLEKMREWNSPSFFEIRLCVFLIVSDWLGDWLLSRSPADRDADSLETMSEWNSPSWRRWGSGTLSTPLRSDSVSSLSSLTDWVTGCCPEAQLIGTLIPWRRWGSGTLRPGEDEGVELSVLLWDQTLGLLYRLWLTEWLAAVQKSSSQLVERWDGGGRIWGAKLPLDTESALPPIYSSLVSLSSP